MAVVSATVQREDELVRSFVGELQLREAHFALTVTAEYLARAIDELAERRCSTADEVWREFCVDAERAIARALAARNGSAAA